MKRQPIKATPLQKKVTPDKLKSEGLSQKIESEKLIEKSLKKKEELDKIIDKSRDDNHYGNKTGLSYVNNSAVNQYAGIGDYTFGNQLFC